VPAPGARRKGLVANVMSDKPKKKEAAPAAAAGEESKKAGGGFLTKLPVLLGGVMVIEAVLLFAGFKMFGGAPKAAAGAELTKEEGHGGESAHGEHGEGGATSVGDGKTPAEVPVVDGFRSPNKVSGHTYFYDVSIVVRTKPAVADTVKKSIDSHGSLIKDRLRTIIAQSDPEKLGGGSEPGLETFRRQVKFQLDEIVGDGLIDEVLVPRCIPFRTDF
jgi:hypothetical protein